jgi:serine/threonine protein kinase
VAQDGQEIAGYKLLKKIGEGGMGQVFLADQLRLKRQVAIKLVHLDVKADVPPGGAEPAEELTREAEALMALEHPHILSLYDTGREGDTAYLVMPYIPEGSLQDALRSGPRQQLHLPLPPGEALLYIEQAASALQYAHDRNFIHRDVKPANFLIRSLSRSSGGGRGMKRLHLFLADFGLSKFLAYSTNTTHLSGTPTYMAPEQFQGHASPASDQYSLAILFFYLLTGDLPYRGSPVELMFRHLNDAPPSVASLVKGIPESLASIVQRGMAKTPEERYPSVGSMAEAAREALAEAGLVPSHDSFPIMPAVRAADLQSEKPREKPKESGQDIPLAPTAVLGSSGVSSAATIITDDLVTSRDPVEPKAQAAESSLPTIAGKVDEGSLPTLPVEKPSQPPKAPKGDKPASEGRPRRRGLMVALAALAAVVLLGAVLGGGAFMQIGPFQKSTPQNNTPVAQITQQPTSAPTTTATLGPTPTPTQVLAADLLTRILAQSPFVTVDLNQGSGPWDGPALLDKNGRADLRTPPGRVNLTNGILTYSARTFPTPLAIAVDLTAASDREFYILLDTTTTGKSGHLYYRLRFTNSAAPQAAHSTNNRNFTNDGTASGGSTAWTDGKKHTLILVLDGTRLLSYFDNHPLVDAKIPLPNAQARLILATRDFASITGIRAYRVPQTT